MADLTIYLRGALMVLGFCDIALAFTPAANGVSETANVLGSAIAATGGVIALAVSVR